MRLAEIQRRGIATEQDRQFIVENLNDLLAGRDAAQNGFAKRFLFDLSDKFLGNLKIDISLEQREPDLAQRGLDVLLADLPMAAEIFEDLLQLVAKVREHKNNRAKLRDPISL